MNSSTVRKSIISAFHLFTQQITAHHAIYHVPVFIYLIIWEALSPLLLLNHLQLPKEGNVCDWYLNTFITSVQMESFLWPD